MTTTPKIYEKLFKNAQNGKTSEWQIRLQENGPAVEIHTEWGYVGGTISRRVETISEGKAKRTVLEQATLEADRKYKNKVEKELYSPASAAAAAAVETTTRPAEIQDGEKQVPLQPPQPSLLPSQFRPMLAKTYDPEKKTIDFPIYVQRKYDGIRCVSYLSPTGQVVMETRQGKSFPNFTELRNQLAPLFGSQKGLILDGELYTNNAETPFEQLSGMARKQKITPEEQAQINTIQYHIYDCYLATAPAMTYRERLQFLQDLFQTVEGQLLCRVPTILVHNTEEIAVWHQNFVEEGFEGIMLRIPAGPYEPDKRSKYLQKYKTFQEEEFDIVGFRQGVAGELGCVVWDCVTPAGKVFGVRPRGTFEQRKEWFRQGSEYVGKKLTVIFQEYSEDGVPRFPVGKAIRDGY